MFMFFFFFLFSLNILKHIWEMSMWIKFFAQKRWQNMSDTSHRTSGKPVKFLNFRYWSKNYIYSLLLLHPVKVKNLWFPFAKCNMHKKAQKICHVHFVSWQTCFASMLCQSLWVAAKFIELDTNLLDLEAKLQRTSRESRTPIG